jgi:hypothetical protein
MNPEYRKLIQYNEHVKLILENRFVYSKFKKIIRIIWYKFSRLNLYLLKLFAILVRPFLKEITSEDCDILVFANSANHLKRSMIVWEELEEKGYTIAYYIKTVNFLTKYIFKYKISFDKKTPYKLFFHHAFARYLSQKYNFRIICDYHNFEVTSALINIELKNDQLNIFIPHGKIRNSYRHSCFTFDYYLVFGESSVEKIFENRFRLGNTKLIKAGSAFIPTDFELDICKNFNHVLFFSNWAVAYHPESKRGFEIVREWARTHPELTLYIRLHPLENGLFVKEHTKDIKNIIIQDKSLSLKESLRDVSVAIATASNASIEAAVLNRPSLIVLDREYIPESEDVYESDNNFFIESYFPKRARNANELHDRFNELLEKYDYYIDQCKKYVNYHLENSTNGGKYIAEIIDKIYKGDQVQSIDVTENISF